MLLLEFFADRPQEPDDVLLAAMAQIGTQLGQVFQRKRADAAPHADKRALDWPPASL